MEFTGRKNLYKKYALYALVIFLAAVCNNSGFVPSAFSLDAMVMVPLCVAVALHEKSIPGMCFGILCGALWDLGSTQFDGFYTVLLTVVGFVCGSLSSFFVRNNIMSSLLLTFVSTVFCNTAHWSLFYLRKGYDGAFSVLFSYYLPSAVYTLVFGAIFYYVISYIYKATKIKKRH